VELDPDSKYEWRRPRGDFHPRYERVTNAWDKFFSRNGLSNNLGKRALLEAGIEGRAKILSAPSAKRVDRKRENLGTFKAVVEVSGGDPYEVEVKQSFWKDEWERLQPGASVPCCVDPDNPKRVLLVAPEPPK
jgi:hypothetical protein